MRPNRCMSKFRDKHVARPNMQRLPQLELLRHTRYRKNPSKEMRWYPRSRVFCRISWYRRKSTRKRLRNFYLQELKDHWLEDAESSATIRCNNNHMEMTVNIRRMRRFLDSCAATPKFCENRKQAWAIVAIWLIFTCNHIIEWFITQIRKFKRHNWHILPFSFNIGRDFEIWFRNDEDFEP